MKLTEVSLNSTEEIVDNIKNYASETDDFKEIFDHLGIKITAGISFLVCQIFNNSYNFLVAFYEKYGNDPLKRDVINQMMALSGYSVVLHNLVCTTLWTWRIIIGPLSIEVAEFESFIQCIFLCIFLLNFAEISLIKALMTVNWTIVAQWNDQFLGKFICWGNLGLVIGIQVSRYFLGCMRETLHFQILTGHKLGKKEDYFWPIYVGITVFLSLFALSITTVQKMVARYKDWELTQKLKNYMIDLGNDGADDVEDDNVQLKQSLICYNNVKHNAHLLNGKETAILATFVFATGLFFLGFQEITYNYEMDLYRWLVFREFFVITLIAKVLIPIQYLVAKKVIRDHIRMNMSDICL